MKDLRILCFGASLVEGYTRGGMRYTPYSISLSRKLKEKYPQAELDVDVNGVSGDRVIGGFKGRMAMNPTPFRILCFGDSLTAGYSRFGYIMAPYSKALKTELEVKFWAAERKRTVETTTEGLSGDLVTAGFARRMERKYNPQALSSSPSPLYHYTIFLGGTNDLAWGEPPSAIWDSIKTITSIPLSQGSKVLLLTVPECAVKDAGLDSKREELNRYIKGDDRVGVYTFDVHDAIPYHSMPESERKEIWDDGLHFTPKGYERMGELIAAELVEILESGGADEKEAV